MTEIVNSKGAIYGVVIRTTCAGRDTPGGASVVSFYGLFNSHSQYWPRLVWVATKRSSCPMLRRGFNSRSLCWPRQ